MFDLFITLDYFRSVVDHINSLYITSSNQHTKRKWISWNMIYVPTWQLIFSQTYWHRLVYSYI